MGKIANRRRLNRMDLAQWVASPDNPYLPCFRQSNLEVILWLWIIPKIGGLGRSRENRLRMPTFSITWRPTFENQWNVKRLIRKLVTSEPINKVRLHPKNWLLRTLSTGCMPGKSRFRIDAEFVRDSASSISGLLVPKIGGISVKPYQPAGYWQHLNFPARKWQAGTGEDLYRRGLYTFHCRSFTHPAMLALMRPVVRNAQPNVPAPTSPSKLWFC